MLLAFLPIHAQAQQTAESPDGGLSLAQAIKLIDQGAAGAVEENPDMWICILIVTALCTGAGIVLYVHYKSQQGQCCGANHKLVLEVSHYDGIWTPIMTNITPVCTNKLKFFEDHMTEGIGTLYRVIDLGVVQWSPYKAAWVP